MIQLRRSEERGQADHGWLKSQHSFSFAHYYDPDHMGFRSLRVINEDRIAGGSGFGAHPHQNMEILSYVIEGGLKHKDSTGTTATIRAGEVQHMSAGSGVMHSEFNASTTDPARFFQIWIVPNDAGGTPGYSQKSFERELTERNLVLVASRDGRDGSLPIKQDAELYILRLSTGQELNFPIRPHRGVWIQVVKGVLNINDKDLSPGDAISFELEQSAQIKAIEESELLIFDLA